MTLRRRRALEVGLLGRGRLTQAPLALVPLVERVVEGVSQARQLLGGFSMT